MFTWPQLTLPHDDVTLLVETVVLPFSASNSSASPHEQSLQALRLPVVPQTKQLVDK